MFTKFIKKREPGKSASGDLYFYCTSKIRFFINNTITLEPLLRGHPDERPTPLVRPLENVNLNINVLISTPEERSPLLKGHIPGAKGVASQEGFHCITFLNSGPSTVYGEIMVGPLI